MGLFDPVTDKLFGEAPTATPSGAFPGLPELGGDYQKFLVDRLNTPASQTETFQLGSQAIRDSLDTQGKTARQRLGDQATTGGFLDSGKVTDASVDIDRAQSQAFASEINNLLLALEDRREQGILPFLSQGAGENSQIQSLNMQSELSRDSLQFGLLQEGLSFVPGKKTPSPTGGFPCWVARAVYGERDPRWLLARKYILTMAPAYLREQYIKYGQALAAIVDVNPQLKARLRPVFDGFVRAALVN